MSLFASRGASGIDFALADHVHSHILVCLFILVFLVNEFLPLSDRDLFNIVIIRLLVLLWNFDDFSDDSILERVRGMFFFDSHLLNLQSISIGHFFIGDGLDKCHVLSTYNWALSSVLDDFFIVFELVFKRKARDGNGESSEGGDQIFIHINFCLIALIFPLTEESFKI